MTKSENGTVSYLSGNKYMTSDWHLFNYIYCLFKLNPMEFFKNWRAWARYVCVFGRREWGPPY